MNGHARQTISMRSGLVNQAVSVQYPHKASRENWPESNLEEVSRIRFQTINQLETAVSLVQTAQIHLKKILEWTNEIKAFLWDLQITQKKTLPPESVINHFLLDHLSKIRVGVEEPSFQGIPLFTGMMGVNCQIRGNRLHFVKGSSRVKTSSEYGYPVAIYQSPRKASLIGTEKLSDDLLKIEKAISLFEGRKEAHYYLKDGENPDSLIENLQNLAIHQGLDLGVHKTPDNHLMIVQNQLGAQVRFKGASYNTRILSEIPGQLVCPQGGRDVHGTIGGEFAAGEGGFLIGNQGNRRTDGLILHYSGEIQYPGQIVGYVIVTQNGRHVPLANINREEEIFVLPSLLPELQAVGVGNLSGFQSLAGLKGGSFIQRSDSLKLLYWVLEDFEFLARDLKQKEEKYVERAVNLLRSSMAAPPTEEKKIYSEEKALQMAEDLRGMLANLD